MQSVSSSLLFLSVLALSMPTEGGDGGNAGGDSGGSGGGSAGSEAGGSGAESGAAGSNGNAGSSGGSGGFDPSTLTGDQASLYKQFMEHHRIGDDGNQKAKPADGNVNSQELLNRWRQNQKRTEPVDRNRQTNNQQRNKPANAGEGKDDYNALLKLLDDRDREKTLAERRNTLRQSFEDMITKPTDFGGVQLVFAEQADVDHFQSVIRDRSTNGFSARDVALIAFAEKIFGLHGKAAVKKHMDGLNGKRKLDGGGSSSNNNVTKKPNAANSKERQRRPGRVPSIMDELREIDPNLAANIEEGKISGSIFG